MKPEVQIKLLRHELRLANAEIAKLRRQLNETGVHGKRIERAYRDGLLLAELAIAHLPTTRAFAQQYGITPNRWENARALLRLAKVHNGKGWLVYDLATIEERLSLAVGQASETPEAFWARLPKHARPH